MLTDNKVLVVEESLETRSAFREMLALLNCNDIDIATDAQEAIPMIERNHYDLVMCFYHLGKGKSGQDLLEEVRHLGHLSYATPFVMILDDHNSEHVRLQHRQMADALLKKPITINNLQECLKVVCSITGRLRDFFVVLDKGDDEKSLTLAEALCEDTQTNALLSQRWRCELLRRLGQYERAAALYRNMQGIYTNEAWINTALASCLFNMGKIEDAHSILLEQHTQHPNALACLDLLGEISLKQNDYKSAATYLKTSCEAAPFNIDRNAMLAQALMAGQRLSEAQQVYEHIVFLSFNSCFKHTEAFLQFVRLAQFNHRYDHAQRRNRGLKEKINIVLRHALSKYQDAPTLLFELRARYAFWLTEQGEQQQARNILGVACADYDLNTEPLSIMVQPLLVETFLAIKDFSEAERILNLEAEGDAELPKQMDYLNEVKEKFDGRVSKARTRQNKKAVDLYKSGNLEAAIEAFDEAVNMGNATPSILLNAIQSKIEYINEVGLRRSLIESCIDTFEKIPIPDTTETSSPRYLRLKEQLERIKRAAGC